MIIYSNIPGLNVLKALSKNEKKAADSLAKLSSGFRINKAADAAAGLFKSTFRSAEFNTIKIFAEDIKRTKTPVPGSLAGDTIIRQYGLQVTAGRNDRLTFRLGGQPFEITLDAGNYTAEQLVQSLNSKFQAAGTDVTVDFEGDSLVYKSPTRILDSFGGSMIAIDFPLAYTSIIYDNSKPGFISGASIAGRQDISSGVTIDSSHDLLAFRLAGMEATQSYCGNGINEFYQ